MTATGLLSVEKQGRHRYHRLAAPSVARMLESIMQVASELAPAGRKLSIGPKDAALHRARTCYDHLAGQLGVSIADGLMRDGYVELAGDAGALICEHSMQHGWTCRLPGTRAVQLTPEGERAFREGFGAQLA
jgi:hypothetical protein